MLHGFAMNVLKIFRGRYQTFSLQFKSLAVYTKNVFGVNCYMFICMFANIENDNLSLRKPRVFVSQILRHYLTKESRIRRLFYCSIQIKEPCVRKFEGCTRSKILGILQTDVG